jgi:hypothetical protein
MKDSKLREGDFLGDGVSSDAEALVAALGLQGGEK